MAVKIILFNGPPRSGKDTAAIAVTEWLDKAYVPVIHKKFAEPLKEAAHILLGLPQKADSFEATKDQLCPEFYNMKPRDVYIWLSEKFLKPVFGPDVFANTFCRSLRAYLSMHGSPLAVVSDCGFPAEAQTAAKEFGSENVLIVQVIRPGCDFSSDSRMYVDGTFFGCRTLTLVNDSSKDQFIEKAIREIDNWLPSHWTNPEELSE